MNAAITPIASTGVVVGQNSPLIRNKSIQENGFQNAMLNALKETEQVKIVVA